MRRGDHRWSQEHLSSTATNTADFCGSTCLIDVRTMHQCHEHCRQQCGPGYVRMRSKKVVHAKHCQIVVVGRWWELREHWNFRNGTMKVEPTRDLCDCKA